MIPIEWLEWPTFDPQSGQVMGNNRRVLTLFDPKTKELASVDWDKHDKVSDGNKPKQNDPNK